MIDSRQAGFPWLAAEEAPAEPPAPAPAHNRTRPSPAFYVDFEAADGARWCGGVGSREEAEEAGRDAVEAFARGGDRLGLGIEFEPEVLVFSVREGR